MAPGENEFDTPAVDGDPLGWQKTSYTSDHPLFSKVCVYSKYSSYILA